MTRRAPAPPAVPPDERILRPREVMARVGLSRVTLWRMRRKRTFPAPVKLTDETTGTTAIGWRASDIEQWLAARVAS